jgi:amino acid adenylation domain-containing protein
VTSLRGERAAPLAGGTVPELVVRRAALAPSRAAVRHGDAVVTYGDLAARSSALADHLACCGVGAGDRVVVCARRSADLVVAALAVMRRGAAYTPVDPAQPAARLDLMIRDSRARIVLVERAAAFGCDVPGVEVVPIDSSPERPAPPVHLTPALPAYVIYTSGSSGVPKGTVLTHATLLNYCSWHCRRYAVSPDDRMAMLVSPAFDVSVAEIWPALVAGAALEVVDDDQRLDPRGLWAWFDRRGTTLMFAPTPLAEAFLAQESSPRALRAMIVGGEQLRRRPRPTHRFEVSNVYGPAEATVGTTEGEVEADHPDATLPDIGRPIANADVYVLDEGGSLVPPGLPGELCIGGSGVGLGYQHRPDLTAERYVPDPFADRPGARMYRTGDLARTGAAGELEYLGRMDQQVKVRGHRVELGEIEWVIASEFGFEAVVVTAPESAELGRRIVAYVVPGGANLPDLVEVRERASRRLPDYMLPAAVVRLDALPLSGSGKVDRSALPDPPAAGIGAGRHGRPTTAVEARVAAIWAEVLGVAEVGPEDNLFALGGHSLLVMEVADRLAEELGVEVELSALLVQPTVAGFAAALDPHRAPGASH